MTKRDIIILFAVMVFLAVRLYQRYMKKESNNSTTDKNISAGTGLSSSSKDDDYEPYSKK